MVPFGLQIRNVIVHIYGGRDVVLGEFSTVSAAAGLRYSGRYPLKQRKEAPKSVWLAFKSLTL